MWNTEKDDPINRSEKGLVVLAGGLGQSDQCLQEYIRSESDNLDVDLIDLPSL